MSHGCIWIRLTNMQKRTYRPEHFMLKPIHGQCGPKYNVLFVARPHTLWCDLSVQMSTQHTECGESNLNCEGGGEKKKKTHFILPVHTQHTHTHTNTNTQKIRHKERNSIEDWSQIAREKLLSQQAKNKYPKFFSLREWYAASPAHSATAVSSFARVNSPFVCLVVLLVYCFY